MVVADFAEFNFFLEALFFLVAVLYLWTRVYDKEFNIVKCALEICRDYKEKVDIEIYLSSFLDDRRKSYAYAFVNNEYITIKNMKERLKNDR